MEVMGIDIGGSGVKAAIVDTSDGSFVEPKERVKTPKPARPEALLGIVEKMVRHFQWTGPVGCGFPGVIRANRIYTAANLHKSLVGLDLGDAISQMTNGPVTVLNDADAAGLCEVRLGEGRNQRGVVLVLTVGTGIGSALFHRGRLVPNTELGHAEFKGVDAETLVSEKARKDKDLDWKSWAKLFDEYLVYMRSLFQPDRIILGGGGVKKKEKFWEFLSRTDDLAFAHFGNQAGIVGAALAADTRD